MRTRRLTLAATLMALSFGALAPGAAGAVGAPNSVPRWVRHVEQYSGGISNGVRAHLDPAVQRAQDAIGRIQAQSPASVSVPNGTNAQMNDDSNPPMPQNETSVAYNILHPLTAVSAANDYVGGGVVIMRTSNGGQSWKSTRITPQFAGTRDYCTGGDPSVAYSLRDQAFYLSQLCFFRSQAYSEAHVYKSVDNGKTWTPGGQAAVAATNYDYSSDTVDESIFVDKEYITVDNYLSSPHYGRLYVTYTKFHIKPSGFSDYCPIQLAYTDDVPTFDPAFAFFEHTAVVPDNPNSGGRGLSANQFSVPVVEPDGTLDIAYVEEDCNTSRDRKLLFQKSSDGGASFLARSVRVDKTGQWKDNPSKSDSLPNKGFRAANTISLALSPTTGTLAFVYANYIDRSTSGGDIGVSLSHDGGLTWSDTDTISTKADGVTPARNDQWFPWIAADPSGNFWVIWFDCRRDSGNHLIDTFQSKSIDDGLTWPNERISTESWDPDTGFFGSGSFIGDYNGLAASDAAVYAVWTDGRDSAVYETGIGETDIFTSVQLQP